MAKWTLKTSPEEYLEKKPDGPNAELAREVIAEQAAEADILGALREAFDAVDASINDARPAAMKEGGAAVQTWKYRKQTAVSIHRDILKLEQRRGRLDGDKLAAAVEVLTAAAGRVAKLKFGGSLYSDDSHKRVLAAFG